MSIATPSVQRTAVTARPGAAPLAARVAKSTAIERPTFESRELLQGASEALIEHRGELYRLRLTGSGKLYLTK